MQRSPLPGTSDPGSASGRARSSLSSNSRSTETSNWLIVASAEGRRSMMLGANRVAVVTGAGGGIGRALSLSLAQRGCSRDWLCGRVTSRRKLTGQFWRDCAVFWVAIQARNWRQTPLCLSAQRNLPALSHRSFAALEACKPALDRSSL